MWAPFFTSLLSVSSPSLAPVSLTMTQEECRNNTPTPSAVEIVHHSWNLFTPLESFSKKKFCDFMIMSYAEKQNQIQGCKNTHRAGTTNTCTGTHTQQITRKCQVTKHIRVFMTGHRGSESSASRVIHHPHVHKHWTDMLIFIRSCRPQDWDWIQRSNHMWHHKTQAQRL